MNPGNECYVKKNLDIFIKTVRANTRHRINIEWRHHEFQTKCIANCSGDANADWVQRPVAQDTALKLITKPKLDNGLEVILHEDRSDPITAVAILFHVGSNREEWDAPVCPPV
ncbi:MAG: hypothetical protein R3C26_18365 [Calditrichia bacterium]